MAVAALLALAALCHRPLLSAAFRWFIIDQVPPSVDQVVAFGGDGVFDEAARRLQSGRARGILLLEGEPIRPVRLGILPSSAESSRNALLRRNVPSSSVTVAPGTYRTDREAALILGAWLQANPEGSLLFLSERLESSRRRKLFDAVLEPAIAARIHVRGLPSLEYDEARWWRSRSGLKHFFYAAFGRLYESIADDRPVERRSWEPDEFAARLRERKP